MQNQGPFAVFETGLAEELGVLPLVGAEDDPGPGGPGAPGLLTMLVNAGAPGGRLLAHLVNV